jgi:hypothetical protein
LAGATLLVERLEGDSFEDRSLPLGRAGVCHV